MDRQKLKGLIEAYQAGELDEDRLLDQLSGSLRDSDGQLYAQIDHQRDSRCGFPEVIYGASKSPEQILGIVEHFHSVDKPVLVTRLKDDAAALLLESYPDADYDALAGTLQLGSPSASYTAKVAVTCAGTSDLPVAREAMNSLRYFGVDAELITDVGVAGLHRLLGKSELIRGKDCLIVVAGMEGALPSVVGGLYEQPIIAVPTSVGYGAGFQGLAALMAMLNSCASGITVTNIDNGFGAACAALRIIRRLDKKQV